MSLLPRRDTTHSAATVLAALVDELTARVREPELVALAEHVDASQPVKGLDVLIQRIRQDTWVQQRVRSRAQDLARDAVGLDDAATQERIARHLRDTVESTRALRADLGALARGQLDMGCLLQREDAASDRLGAQIEVALCLLPALSTLASDQDDAAALQIMAEGEGLATVLALAAQEPRRPTRLAAVRAIIGVLDGPGRRWGLGPAAFRVLERVVKDPHEDPWLRRAALGLCEGAPRHEALPLLMFALAVEGERDHHLVRARAVGLALERPDMDAWPVVHRALGDHSELVRFVMADALATRLGEAWRDATTALELVAERADPRTRARLAWALRKTGPAGLDVLAGVLADPDALVVRTAMEATIASLRDGTPPTQRLAEAAALEAFTRPHGSPSVRRRAAVLRHLLLAASHQAGPLATELAQLEPGQRVTLRLPHGVSPLALARCLVHHADVGHGFVLDPEGPFDQNGVVVNVLRGEEQAPALWRILDELRNPAPAKRQAHSHANAVADAGPLRVPPGGLAEATPTGVPGQRVHVERQDSWAPEVPMVDDLLHALRHGEVVLVTPLGITRVHAPSVTRRFTARWRLTWGYRALHTLRTAALSESDSRLRQRWDDQLSDLGFRIETDADPLDTAPPARTWLDPVAFALTMSGSTLQHLGIVLALLAAGMFTRLGLARHRLRRARAAIPLVIGGWGTRGKSGTERLKAGLFEALGVPFLSKTTGCEAMVLHAPPGGRARELFLYRPYDKATIWEQADVVTLAPSLGTRVFLWECMALNPKYVDLLQHWWMRDDISTLTNAFPDHEDIQGPTGQDVAEVIAGFAPPRGHLLTTEEGMLPILRTVAHRAGASVEALAGPEHALMPRDLLDRFRHREHPANVALVARLAQGLGVPWVEAVGWMAERVVADVGALVVHRPVRTEGREVTFAQGQSANDPLSFRHSWRTAGYEEACPLHEWRVTVVNNRADRVARSRMFAGLLADLASAHRHVLIGTNLQGLRSYLRAAVDARLDRTDMASQAATQALFAHLRIVEPGPLGDALGARLGIDEAARLTFARAAASLTSPADPSWGACRQAAEALRPAANTLAQGLTDPGQADQLVSHLVQAAARHLAQQAALTGNATTRAALYRALVDASLEIIDDDKASGDAIIHRAVHTAPPGAVVRLMGLQNIKGTGLDFAYRWVEWGELTPLVEDLASLPEEELAGRLRVFGTRSYGSAMACDGVLSALSDLSHPDAAAVITHVHRQRLALVRARTAKGGAGGPIAVLLSWLERIFDPFHGIWRRRRSAALLGELAAGRISHDRAQVELRRLTLLQKGGWLRGA